MRRLLTMATMLVAAAACGSDKDNRAAQQDHVVTQKVAPDTLVDKDGLKCVVSAQVWDSVTVNQPFSDCTWQQVTLYQRPEDMQLHSRTMVVRAVEEFDADNDRVILREQATPGSAGSAPMAGGGGTFFFTIPRAESPKVLDEVEVSVNTPTET